MSAFDDAFEVTVKLEGANAYGITEDVARAEGYTGAMSELPWRRPRTSTKSSIGARCV